MPVKIETVQATLMDKSSSDSKTVALIFLQETKKLPDNTTCVTLDLSEESMSLLKSKVDFLCGLFSYYRAIVETYDLSSDRCSNQQVQSAYKQYMAIQSWLPLMLSSVLTGKVEWTPSHDQLWQCLDENSKALATLDLRSKCSHLPVLPVYQLRSQSVTRLLEKLQKNRSSLDGAEIRIVESYFEDTVFYSSPAEEQAALMESREVLFWAWFALIFSSPGSLPPQSDFQKRLKNMFLNSRSPEERFARISRILQSPFVSSSVMQWLCQESVQRFSGHTFTEIMKADISALEEAAKAKIQLENLIKNKLESLKSWFDNWISYCERNWTLGTGVEPGMIILSPFSSFMPNRSASVYGAAAQENTSYLERGVTTIVDTVSHTYIKAYSWAQFALYYLPASSGSTIAIRATAQTTQFWISRNLTQYVPQVLFGASVLQASIAYTIATAALGQRNRAYYHYSRWMHEESPYESFKQTLWRSISEKLMCWLLVAKDTDALFDFFTHEARNVQHELSLHLGGVTLVSSILITGAKEFDRTVNEENDRLPYIRARLQAIVEVAQELWSMSIDGDTIAAIVAQQPAICFSRKTLLLIEDTANPELQRAIAAPK